MSLDYLISRFNTFTLGTQGLTLENLPNRVEKNFTYTPNSKTLYVLIPGWGNSLDELKRVLWYAVKTNCSFIEYSFSRSIFSDDYKITRDSFEYIRKLVRDDIRKFKELHNFSTCVLIGCSLGSVQASMIANDNPDVNKLILITPGNCLAEAMWTGCRTQHLRRSYERQGISLKQLKEYWYDLAPENNVNLENKKVIIYTSEEDKVILHSLSKILFNKIKEKGIDISLKENKYLGHYLTLAYFYFLPKKFLNL